MEDIDPLVNEDDLVSVSSSLCDSGIDEEDQKFRLESERFAHRGIFVYYPTQLVPG